MAMTKFGKEVHDGPWPIWCNAVQQQVSEMSFPMSISQGIDLPGNFYMGPPQTLYGDTEDPLMNKHRSKHILLALKPHLFPFWCQTSVDCILNMLLCNLIGTWINAGQKCPFAASPLYSSLEQGANHKKNSDLYCQQATQLNGHCMKLNSLTQSWCMCWAR